MKIAVIVIIVVVVVLVMVGVVILMRKKEESDLKNRLRRVGRMINDRRNISDVGYPQKMNKLSEKSFQSPRRLFKAPDHLPKGILPRENFSDGVCTRDANSKKVSEGILNKLKHDLYAVSEKSGSTNQANYGDESISITKIIEKLKFSPLECCDLEDSLTEDKKKVFICVKNKNGKYYNYNKLMQVALHELAHAISKGVDPQHKSEEFNDNYNYLIKIASDMNLIDVSRLNERE